MLPVPPSSVITPQITQMSRDSRMAGAFKVENMDRDSGQRSGHSWKSSADRERRDSVVGEFSEPLIDFIELSNLGTAPSVYLLRVINC
jgi:hypothetical protein